MGHLLLLEGFARTTNQSDETEDIAGDAVLDRRPARAALILLNEGRRPVG
jgi:hypothetical protein